MNERLTRFAQFTVAERRLVLTAAVVVAAVKVALLTMPVVSVRRCVDAIVDRSRGRPRSFASEAVAWAVMITSRRIPGGNNCQVRALATKIMLSRYGYESTLRFGAPRSESRDFTEHAWLEHDGRIIMGAFQPDRHYPHFRLAHSDEPQRAAR